jgi:hypothetical protein
MNVRDYVIYETERQHGTMAEAIGMFQAWEFFCRWNAAPVGSRKRFDKVLSICYQHIKMPGTTRPTESVETYRKVPAVFNQGLPALEASLIPHAMQRLCEAMTEPQDTSLGYDNLAAYYTREFLLIHPFSDGNGRVGSLLWNFWCGTLSDPKPMPYFFGER